MKFLIINGPNINMLGLREPSVYGAQSYAALQELIRSTCAENGIDCELFQSNHEGAIVDKIQQACGRPSAPFATAVFASKHLDAVSMAPRGKPTTQQTGTRPARYAAA